MLLVLMTFTNFAMDLTQATRASDFLRPALVSRKSHHRQSLGLGSAAIQSLTNILSPVLPFTGGVDLRRPEHRSWEALMSWYYSSKRRFAGTKSDPVIVATVPRGGHSQQSLSHADAARQFMELNKKRKVVEELFIGSTASFYPLDKIVDLTLDDITNIISYSIQSGNPSTDNKKLRDGMNARAKDVIDAMEKAVASSRGKDVQAAALTTESKEQGEVDALFFCAAMRIFAEWRILRQVPEGYKGYMVGMTLGQRDVVQNVAKIESAVHSWIEGRRHYLEISDLAGDEVLRSPTLRELLKHDIDMDVHPNNKLPRLKDKTAAMGLLWVRRQLQYQTVLFANVLEVPRKFATTIDAVSAAYATVYGQFHGWAVQKIFNYSFQAAPEDKEIYKYMNPHRLKEVKEVARKIRTDGSTGDVVMAVVTKKSTPTVINASAKPSLEQEDTNVDKQKEDCDNPFLCFFDNIGRELGKFGKGIGNEWDKFVCHILRKQPKEEQQQSSTTTGDVAVVGLEGVALDEFIAKEMTQDAHQHISSYLTIMTPLLDDLAGLFHEMNMDDPTKV